MLQVLQPSLIKLVRGILYFFFFKLSASAAASLMSHFICIFPPFLVLSPASRHGYLIFADVLRCIISPL